MGGGDVIDGGPMPWPLGDKIIAGIASLLAAQAARVEKVQAVQAQQVDATVLSLTPEDKLARIGLTIADLKILLGL